MTHAPGHPVATSRGLTLLHRKVLYDAIGPGPHPCHWCGTPVAWKRGREAIKALVVDHLNHDKDDNDPGNLVPSCNACNGHRMPGDNWQPWKPGDPIGESPRQSAACRRGHRFTPENVYIRPDTGGRMCRACARWRRSKRTVAEADFGIPAQRIERSTDG